MAMDLTFGYGVVAFLLIGAGLIAANYIFKKELKGISKYVIVAGVAFLLCGGATYMIAQNPAADTADILTPGATFGSVCAAPSTHTTIQNNSKIINVAMNYNTTSNAFVSSTNVATLNFTISRSDAGIADAVATCSLGNVPLVGITGATSQPIVALNSDNTYNAKFAKAGGFSQYESGTVLVSAGSSAWMTVTITANAAAADGMSQYQVMQVPLNIGGQVWNVNFQLVTITT
jgi:hypothetical protein